MFRCRPSFGVIHYLFRFFLPKRKNVRDKCEWVGYWTVHHSQYTKHNRSIPFSYSADLNINGCERQRFVLFHVNTRYMAKRHHIEIKQNRSYTISRYECTQLNAIVDSQIDNDDDVCLHGLCDWSKSKSTLLFIVCRIFNHNHIFMR